MMLQSIRVCELCNHTVAGHGIAYLRKHRTTGDIGLFLRKTALMGHSFGMSVTDLMKFMLICLLVLGFFPLKYLVLCFQSNLTNMLFNLLIDRNWYIKLLFLQI